MVSYDSPIMDQTRFKPLRILVSDGRFDSHELNRHILADMRDAPAAALASHQPDLLILDATCISPVLRQALEEPRHHGLPIILIAGEAEADAAGLLMGANIVAFLPPHPASGEIAEQVGKIGVGNHVADAGTGFNPQARIEELRRDAERMAAAIAELAGRGHEEKPHRMVDAARIRAHIKARRLRDKFFPADLFPDPAWDMLLDLAAARLEGQQVSVSSLCIAANVPTTTGLRWIKTMIDRGMFERHADPQDARRAFIMMTPPTTEAMTACLDVFLNAPD